MSTSSGPNTCRRSARSRNVSESSESSWLGSDGRGNVGQPARQFRCPADSGSHSDNNSPERVKRKKRRKNVYDFSAEERKKVMKRRVAELVKQNRLYDELLRLKLKDTRVPLVLLKRLEREPISQPKLADETGAQTKLEDESLHQKKLEDESLHQNKLEDESLHQKKLEDESLHQNKLEDVPQAQVLLSNEPSAQEKLADEECVHVKHADEPPAGAKLSEEPHTQKRPKGRAPSKSKLAKELSHPKFPNEPDQPDQPKLAKEIPRPKLPKELPQSKLANETPQAKLAKGTPLPKLANETPQPKLPKDPPQSKLAKNSSQPKLTKDSSESKLAKEPSQPKLAKEKSTEEKSEEKKEEVQQECAQMTNVILPRKIDPSILKRRLVVRINKRQTDRLVAKKINLQRRLLKELSAEKERVASIAESTPVNSGDSDKCAARLTEKSDNCLPDVNKCTKNPIVSSGKKQLQIPIDKSNNDRLPEKLLEDNSRCMLNSLSLSEASVAENQPESSKSLVHSNKKSKRKTVDQINDKDSIDLVEVQPNCIKDNIILKGDEKHSNDSSKDVKKYSKNSVKDIDEVSQQIIVKSNKTTPEISGDSVDKRQLFSAKEIKERRTEDSHISKVLKNSTEIRTRPRRNLASKSDNSVDSSSDNNEKLSIKLDKVIQHNLKSQAASDNIVKKNEAEKCDIQSTVEKTLETTEKSVEKCSKSSESDENLKYSKDKTECNKILEKLNNEKKIHSEGVVENHVIENVVNCGDTLPQKLNKNVNKRIKNQTEKSLKITRNIHNKIEKQADNAQKNQSSSQSVVKDNNECHSNNLEIVTEKFNNDSKEPIESTNKNLEKSVTLVKESSANDSKNYVGKVKRISKKPVQSSTDDKAESLSNSISEAVRDVCETTVQISVKNKNENLSKHFDEKIKKSIKVSIEPVKYQKTNVDTLCNEKFSKNAEKTENFVKNPVEKHNKKHADAKEENQISFNLADVNQRPKRNIIKRNLEIYANTCTPSKVENNIVKHNERLLENLNKNDAAEVGKRNSRKLSNKEVHLENIEQKLENEKLPIEKSKEKVPDMLNVNTTDLKPETATGKRSKRILALDKHVKSTESLISNDVDNKDSHMKENEKQLTELQKITESCRETEVQNNIIAIPALPQKLDKKNVDLIENVPDSVHNFIPENVSKESNEASSKTIIAAAKRRSRRRKSLPDADEKIIRNIVKSASIPDNLQNQIEHSLMNNLNDQKDDVERPEQSSVKILKKCTRLQVTIEKRITRNSIPEDKSIQISTENEVDLVNQKVDSNKSIPDKTRSTENLHKIDSVIDYPETPIENSEAVVIKSTQNDVERSDQLTDDTPAAVKKNIKSKIINQKRVTRKTLASQHEMCIQNSSVNSEGTVASTVVSDQEKQIENSEKIVAETVQNNIDVNSHIEDSREIITEPAQNNVGMSDQHTEDLQKAIKEISKSEIRNQKRIKRKTSPNKREKHVQKSTFATSEYLEGSTDQHEKRVTRKSIPDKNTSIETLHETETVLDHREKSIENAQEVVTKVVQNDAEMNGHTEDSQAIIENTKSQITNKKRLTKKALINKRKKRVTRKSISDKTKITETLHKIEPILDHPEKPIENAKEVIKEAAQNDVEMNGYTDDTQKANIEDTESQIANQKKVTRKSSLNKHEKQIENTTAISEDIENSTGECKNRIGEGIGECKKRITRKTISDKTKLTETLHKIEPILDHPEKPIENTEEVIKEAAQNDVEMNGYTDDSQKMNIEDTESQIANQKRVTRKSSPNKYEKQIENTSAISEAIESSTDECKKRITRKTISDKTKLTETLHKIEPILDHPEKPIENAEEVIKEAAQNDVEMNGYTEDSQKANIEDTESQITNQKRVTRKSLLNKHEKQIENTSAISEDIESSTGECKKRITRKTISDKTKLTETLHKIEPVIEHPEKSIENAEEIIKEAAQIDVEMNGCTEDSQTAIVENTKSQIINQKRVTRKSSPNKHEKQIENTSAISEDVEGSVDKNKKRVTRKSISDKTKLTETLHKIESVLEHPEKPIENAEVIKEAAQIDVEMNGYTEDSQTAIIENTKSQIVNQKRVTRKSSPNKHEKRIENTPAVSEDVEGSVDKNKKRVTRKSISDKTKLTETLHKIEPILEHSEKPIENVEVIKEAAQIDVKMNGYTEDSQTTIIENTKSQIVNQKRVTRKSSPNKHEKHIEITPAISEDVEGSVDKNKKRATRKSITNKSEVAESLHKDESILDHRENSIENAEVISAEAVQNDVEIGEYTEDSQKFVENTKRTIVNQKRGTRKSLPNKQEKRIENTTSVMSEDIEVSVDDSKNKSGSVRRTTRKARLEKHVESISVSDDKIVEEPQKINKECSKSEKAARKVSPDKYDKQTDNLMINNLDAVMNSIDEEDKILSETLDNKENTKTQIEVNTRVTRNSSLKKDRHTKNLIENNVDCVHNEDNKDKSLENIVSTVKVFSKNLTENKKFRKTSVDKVNEIQTENLVDNSSASLQNFIEENEQKQFEGSLKRISKEFTESTKRKSTQSDSEVNSVNMQHSLDENSYAVNNKATIVVENNKRVTRKSAEMHSEAIAKDSANLTDHNVLSTANEKSLAVCDESESDSLKIIQSDVSKSPAEAKGLVNSIKSFNEHNDTCKEIMQLSIDVNNESQPNNKQVCSDPLIERVAEDTKTTVAVKIATDSVEKSEKALECSLAESRPDQQTTLNDKNDSVSKELSTRSSKRVSLRAFRKVKERKPVGTGFLSMVPISVSSSVSIIESTAEKEENRAENLNENVVHAVVESNKNNKDVLTELSVDNVIPNNDVIEENVKSDVEKVDDSFNVSSPNLDGNEKIALNTSQKSNKNDLESTCENGSAIITESIADKLDENVEKLQDAHETAAKDKELIENKDEINEDSLTNQESNETTSQNSFKSALDIEVETFAETPNPVEDISCLNSLEIPQLDSLCNTEVFPTNTVEGPLEEVLNNLELPSSESLNSIEIPTFEPSNLDAVTETVLEDVENNIETCSKTILENAIKTPENEESSAKKRRLATLLELKRKCTENLDKKQAVEYQSQLKDAIDSLVASGCFDSIDPSSDSCLGNGTENEENFESLSDEFDNDENLASRLANLNNLKIPPLDTEQDSSLVVNEENEKEKPATKSGMSFLEMNAMTCTYCDKCFTSNRQLKKHVKVQHRQRLVIKITKTDSNEHKTQMIEHAENSVPEQEPPLIADVDAIPPNERFPMVAEEEPITDGEIKIIVKKESGSKNSHVVKEIKITPKSSDGGSSVRIPGFSPALSDGSAGGSSINSPSLEAPGQGVVKKVRGRPRKYPIFTETEIIAKQMAAQVLAQEQERVKLQQQISTAPVFEPVESIIPPFEERAKEKSVTVEPSLEVPKERVKRKRKVRVFDNEDTEEEDPLESVRVKKRRGRPPRKRPEQLLQELNERLLQAQNSPKPQHVEESLKLQVQESQQAEQPPTTQQVQEQRLPKSLSVQEPLAVVSAKEQPALQELPNLQVPEERSTPRPQTPKPLSLPMPALVPTSMPIRITSSLPLPLLTPTRRSTAMPRLKQTPVPPLTQTPVPPLKQTPVLPLRQTAIPPLRQTPVPFLIPSLTPTLSMPSLAPLSTAPAPAPTPAAPDPPDSDEKRRKLVESLQEFIVIGPEEKKRRLEGAAGQEVAEDETAASESPDATDVSKPEKGLLTRKFGMTKELVVRLTKIDTVPKDCEDFNGDVDDSERIDGDPKASSDERPRRKLKPKLPNEEEESSRESLSTVVRMNLRRKLENNNNHVNDVEKCLAATSSPRRTQPSDGLAPEAATSDAAKKQSDSVVQQEATNNQLVVTPRRQTMDKAEADESQKAKLMMLMNATTPNDATNKTTSSVTESPRALPQSQPQIQMQLQNQPQNQLQVHIQTIPLPLPQMQHQAYPQPQPQLQPQSQPQVQQPVQTQPQTVLQLQQPQQFCILFIPDYDGNGPRDVAPTATIVNFQPVPDNEIHNKPLIYMPTTPTKISVDDHAKAYVCANCTKVLDLIGRLEASVGMTEEDKSAITCPYCSNHFQSLFYLEYHVMHEHLKCENEKQCRHSRVNSLRIPNHEVATEFESYITFALKCRSCYDIFGSVLALNDHVMHKHKTLVRLRPAAPAASGSSAYPVPFVGKNGAIGAVLQCPSDCVCRIGIRSTDTPLQRQQMLKRCPNAMRRLEKIEPAAYEVYTCTLCKSTFLMKDEVVDHLMKMHEVSCKFPCYTCLTSFRTLQSQENHRCSETTLQDFDKLLNIAILPTNVGGKEHNNKFLEREDSSTDEYGAMKTTSPRAPPAGTVTTPKNGMKRKNGATIAALSQLLNKKPKLMNTSAQPVQPSKRKRKRACPKCKKRFAYRKSLHDHVIYEHIMKGESADGPKKTAVELLMLLSNNRANYKRIEELAEMLNGYTDEDGVSLRKLAMMEDNELENEEDSSPESATKEPRTGTEVAQCIRCKIRFSLSSGNSGQSTSQDGEQRKPLLCDNCEGVAGTKTRRRGPVSNGQHSDDESSDSQSTSSQKMLMFACKKCPETFPTVIELKSHKRTVHAKQGVEHLYSCDICTKSFAAPRMLEKHKKIHRESVLDASAKPEEDEANRSSSQNSGDNSKDSEANDSLNDKVNSSNRRDSSDSSGAGSKEPEEQLLDCSFCEEVCSSKVSLKNHLKREHGRRASICQFCNGLLIDTSEVRHMLDYHIVPSKTSTRQTIVRNNGNSLHCGDSCMQEDVDELIRTLGKHRLQSLMVYHDFEGKCNNAIMRCPICPELFATRESCRFHYVWIHDDNCLLCDETFRSGSSACQHKVDAHTSTASYLWCIQRLVTTIVNTLNLDPDQPSHVLYQVLAMRLDDEEEEARIASETTAGDTAEKGTNEEAPSATERFLEEVLSEDQLPDSGNMIEVVIGREDSEDDLLSMLNLSPNYETCEQLPNASAAPPEEEEEDEVTPAPTSPTATASSVIVPVPTTPTAAASTSLATTVSSPVASSPTTVTTASPVLGNYCASGVYLCKHSDGDEQFVLVVAGEDETTYKNDIGSLAVRISETCEVFTLEEITEMLRVHFANLNQNSDGGA